MRRITYAVLCFAVASLAVLFAINIYVNKIKKETALNQLVFDWMLLMEINREQTNIAGKLLSADIQRIIISLENDLAGTKKNDICKYIGLIDLRTLQKYDENISLRNLKKTKKYCND